MSSAIVALLNIVRGRIVGAGVWQSRVYLTVAPSNTPFPMCVIAPITLDIPHDTLAPDALCTLEIHCISEDANEALTGLDQLGALLAETGTQDKPASDKTPLAPQLGWKITTMTLKREILTVSIFENAQPRYHAQAQFEINLAGV